MKKEHYTHLVKVFNNTISYIKTIENWHSYHVAERILENQSLDYESPIRGLPEDYADDIKKIAIGRREEAYKLLNEKWDYLEAKDRQKSQPLQDVAEPQQEERKQAMAEIPTIHDTDKEKFIFGNAIKKEYMSLSGSCYKWKLSKSLLAYMCGRLYCGDRIKEEDDDKWLVKGNTQMPKTEVEKLFGGIDVASNRYSLKVPPRNYWKIDGLFEKEASK